MQYYNWQCKSEDKQVKEHNIANKTGALCTSL